MQRPIACFRPPGLITSGAATHTAQAIIIVALTLEVVTPTQVLRFPPVIAFLGFTRTRAKDARCSGGVRSTVYTSNFLLLRVWVYGSASAQPKASEAVKFAASGIAQNVFTHTTGLHFASVVSIVQHLTEHARRVDRDQQSWWGQ